MEFLIKTNSIGGLTEEQFFHFCQENQQLKFEKTSAGEILLMAPTGSETDRINFDIGFELGIWNRKKNLGVVFGSNAGFTLPNNAVRSPDVAFIYHDEWNKVELSDKKRFAHVCPDFVIELISESDDERATGQKMSEWIENGCSLAWMIDPYKKQTTVYRKGGKVSIIEFDDILFGENILPEFTLDLKLIFN
jgi:Uma2 family endonuclease